LTKIGGRVNRGAAGTLRARSGLVGISHRNASWSEALARAADARRMVVIGPADVGKSSFIREVAAERAPSSPPLGLLDLDPGQKMLGAPGCATAGLFEPGMGAFQLTRFIFLGSTGIGSFRALAAAAAELALTLPLPLIVNTGGYVGGPGARLQAMTIAALRPDLVIGIGPEDALGPILSLQPAVPALLTQPHSRARRKTAGERAGVRQRALEAALAGAGTLDLDLADASFDPAAPVPLEANDARPVCALRSGTGEDVALGILLESKPGSVRIHAPVPLEEVRQIVLGKMWARPCEGGGWRLLERLRPSWEVVA
jgi:polynucleotide 5'-kinase involved in rRNA processing